MSWFCCRAAEQDATDHSLVLIDELGKGTEGAAGAAIAGALLERFDQKGCRGVFATHHHAMLDLTLKLQQTEKYKMGTIKMSMSGA